MCISPVDKDGDGENDDKDKADHHGNHLMHCYCTCVGEKGKKHQTSGLCTEMIPCAENHILPEDAFDSF